MRGGCRACLPLRSQNQISLDQFAISCVPLEQVLEVVGLDMPGPIVKATLPVLEGFAGLRQLSISVVVKDCTALEGSTLSGLTALQDLRLSFWERVTFGKAAARAEPAGDGGGEPVAGADGDNAPVADEGSKGAAATGQGGEHASSSGGGDGGGEPAELLPSLTRLELQSVDQVDTAAALPALRELVTDEVKHVRLQCALPALTSLQLSGGGGGQVVTLEADFSGLPALAELRLENVEPAATLTWPGSAFSALPRLAALTLSCSTKTAQQAAAALLRAAPASLRSLELRVDGDCGGSLAAAVGGLTQLTRLVANTAAVAQHLKALSCLRELQLPAAAQVRVVAGADQLACLCCACWCSQPP
jgi:hypothetical protein